MTAFSKMNGLGYDFVMFDGMKSDVSLTERHVARLCDRHFGIGADGVIVVQPSPRAECAGYMHYINADGTLAQMCGNGVRCFAKFLVDHGYLDEQADEFIADTMAGPRRIRFTRDAAGKLAQASVRMGVPILEPAEIPVASAASAVAPDGRSYVREMPLDSPWGTFAFTCVSMGNPHAVCFIDSFDDMPADAFVDPTSRCLASLDVAKIGAFFESHPAFPEKANIEFAEMTDTGIAMRVFERGCAETLACGTGACAVQVAAVLTQGTSKQNEVHLLGGTLRIAWLDDGEVEMTGPAACAYTGTVDLSAYDK